MLLGLEICVELVEFPALAALSLHITGSGSNVVFIKDLLVDSGLFSEGKGLCLGLDFLTGTAGLSVAERTSQVIVPNRLERQSRR